MKMRFALATLILTGSTLVLADESQPAPTSRPSPQVNPPMGGGARGNRPVVPATIGSAMRDMQQVWTRLSKEDVDPAQKDAALMDILLMQRDAAIAKTGTPGPVRRMTGDAKVKALGEYRALLTKLLKTFLDLEDAIAAGNADTVKTLSEQVKQIEKDGHAQFAPEE